MGANGYLRYVGVGWVGWDWDRVGWSRSGVGGWGGIGEICSFVSSILV